MSARDDLDQTVKAVEALDRRIVAEVADVRDQAAVSAVAQAGIAEFGHIDVVCANAGIASTGLSWELDETTWQDMLDVNLTGVWHTTKAVLPSMIDAGKGGSIVMTSSLAGVRGLPNVGHYVAAKTAVVGLMRSMANEVGAYNIRVNAVLPGNVRTPMHLNDVIYGLFRPDLDDPNYDDCIDINKSLTSLDVDLMEPRDISNAVLWLASDEARFVTGVAISVDGGWANK
jgi:SDR family mycofactocin-dependent oxidoreductase